MSGAGEERSWGAPRGQQKDQNRNPNQIRHYDHHRRASLREGNGGAQHQGLSNPPSQGSGAMSGNAWVNNDRTKREAPPFGPAQEQHIPLNGFNAQDARNILKSGFSADSKKATSYKSSSQAQGVKSGSPWATKPNTMGNGKDFFLELRKQLSTLQQQGPERAGG